MPLFEKGTPGGACYRTDCDNAGIFTHSQNGMRYCKDCAVLIERHTFSGSYPQSVFPDIQQWWHNQRKMAASKNGGMTPAQQTAETNYQLFAKK